MGKPNITTEERLKVYEELLRIKRLNKFRDFNQIIRYLSKKFCAIPSKKTIKRWISEETSPLTSFNKFVVKPSPELSYFLGAWLGDGWADDSDGGKRILLQVTDRGFAERFARSAQAILNKNKPYKIREINKQGTRFYLVKVTSLFLYGFIHKSLNELKPYIDRNPIEFLKGIYDAEGSVNVNIVKRGTSVKFQLSVTLSLCDKELLIYVKHLLHKLGIKTCNLSPNPKRSSFRNIKGRLYRWNCTEWHLRIVRINSLRRFAKIIGFNCRAKSKKLNECLTLLHKYGSYNSAIRWLKSYKKLNGRWVKVKHLV